MSKGTLSIVIAAVLAVSLLPASALAADLGAGGASAASAPAAVTNVSTQSSKVKMWVVKKIGSGSFTYNKNGFVTKSKSSVGTKTYKYSGARIVSSYDRVRASSPSSVKVDYDKKGRVKKVKSSGASSYSSYIDTYTYNKKGRVSKVARKYTMMSGGFTTKYSYDKKGRLKTSLSNSGLKITYTYNGHGHVESTTAGASKGYGFMRYIYNTYTYKNGRVVKRSQTMNGTGGAVSTVKFSYKQVSVPKKYVSKVKKQQRVLVGNTDPAVVL